MCKRGLCCRPKSIHLSLRPSVTFVHCIHTAGDIIKLLCRPSSPITLVFFDYRCWYQFQVEPPAGMQNTWGWEIFLAIFEWNLRLSRKRYEIGPWLLWNFSKKLYALYRMVTVSLTLNDPNPFFKVTAFLKSNISKTVRLTNEVTVGQW